MKLIKTIIKVIGAVIILLLAGLGLLPTEEAPEHTAQPLPDGSYIQVHFIDVGQADAALVVCDGETMLIDGGNVGDSSLLYTYLKDRRIDHLNYVVGTHAHEDHIGGLSGALNYASVDTVLCPVTNYDSKAFQNFKKTLTRQGVDITVPNAGDSFSLGGAQVTILSCDSANEDTNATSIVLRIDHGETSFLFTGDAERETEQAILNSGLPLQATVLKVGHHGSDTSTGYQFLWNVMPGYAVISVGADNSYGHPTQAVLSRLEDADAAIFRTDLQGDILCTGDGRTLTFTTEKS